MGQELEQDRHSVNLGTDLEIGHEPFGDADPGVCGADASECETPPHELDGPPERSEVAMIEEVFEPFVGEKTVLGIDPTDGLPVPMNEGPELHEAPAFRYENFICVEDAREYVEILQNEIDVAWDRNVSDLRYALEPTHGAVKLEACSYYGPDGAPRARRAFKPEDVKRAFGLTYVSVAPDAFVLVRPKRPRCEHLRRQVLSQDGVPEGERGHFLIFRNCSVRRSVGGALMSLRDQAVYACDYRSPADPESTKRHLDEPEKKQLERPDTRLPMFSGPAVPLPDLEA